MLERPNADDLTPLNERSRLSPKAIRSMIAAYCAGTVTSERGLITPHSRQAALAAAAYAYFTDLVSADEMRMMWMGKAIHGNLCTREEELLLPEHALYSSRIFPTLEDAALDPRWIWPGTTKVFFHGTWDGFLHPGHILYISDTLDIINTKFGIPWEKMMVLVSCDQNAEIESAKGMSVMDTVTRASMMSYLPYVDAVAPSGSWGDGDVNAHWGYKLGLLRPNFVSYEASDPRYPQMAERASKAGATVIPNIREGTGNTNFVFNPYVREPLPPLPGNPMSSRNLQAGIVGERERGIDFQFTQPLFRLIAKKQIREELYGIRDWFGNYPEP